MNSDLVGANIVTPIIPNMTPRGLLGYTLQTETGQYLSYSNLYKNYLDKEEGVISTEISATANSVVFTISHHPVSGGGIYTSYLTGIIAVLS